MYADIKTAMQAKGHPVSAGDAWTISDSSQFRDFAHFTLGVPQAIAHHILSFPASFKDAVAKIMSPSVVAMSGPGDDELDDAGENYGNRTDGAEQPDGEPDSDESDDAGENYGNRTEGGEEPDESDDAGEHLGN